MKFILFLFSLLFSVCSHAQFELETHIMEKPDHFIIFYADNAAGRINTDPNPGVVKIRKMNDQSSPFDCANDTVEYLMNLYYRKHCYYRFTVEYPSVECIKGIEEKLINRTSKLKWTTSEDSVLVSARPYKKLKQDGIKYFVVLNVYSTDDFFSIDSMKLTKAEWKVLRKKISETTIYPEGKLKHSLGKLIFPED